MWAYNAGALTLRSTVPGARADSPGAEGDLVMTAGAGIARSLDGGVTWRQLDVDPNIVFDDIRVNLDGSAVAVGTNGAVANIGINGAVTISHVGDANLHHHIHDSEIGYAGGDDGQVLITNDSGLNWHVGPNVGRTVRGVDGIGFNHR